MSTLTYILGWPLLGAGLVALIPRNYRFVIRIIALLTTFLSMLLAVKMFLQFQTGLTIPQFAQKVSWVESLGISYYVGVDGLNVGLVLMGAMAAFAATCVSWEIKDRPKEFYFLLLVMIGGVLGTFASLDIFLFFLFHELALIPTFIMIGVWGRGADKNYATFQITLYLTVGALVALVGLVALYVQSGARTFDMIQLTQQLRANPLSVNAQHLIFPFLLFGFGILVSLWPFHTWAPLGYGAAPTATAMLHAGVLKKFGLYGLIRIALPMLPEGAQSWLHVISILCLGNILYVGLVAIRQKELNLLIGNSSVAHMGFIFLGVASLNLIGITGAVVVMIAHGFLAALSFALSGYLYQQTGTLEMKDWGGLLRKLPFVGAAFVMAALAACGLPGFANFVGEVMVFFSAWKPFPVVTVLALWGGLVIGAVYMLRAVRAAVHGPLPEKWNNVTDASAWRKVPFVLLLGGLIILGCFPRLLTDKIRPNVEEIVKLATRAPVQAAQPVKTAAAPQGAGAKE
ncbi:MAG: NADH-quinone oxidoreductase subunit M [Verrucomicrobiales bacterium]|nr:NADH-quinone oxidoreductase subunit M [Verrucomicrobiales bacterium]